MRVRIFGKMRKLIRNAIFLVTSPRRFVREQVKLPLAKFIYDTVDIYKSRTKTGVNNVRDILFRGTVIALITALVVWLSIFMYVAFYYAYVPAVIHEKPAYLKFRSCDKWDIHKNICSFPSANVQLNKNQRSLMAGQPYKVFLDLEMPESPTNKDLGMFMVCADFHGNDGKIITNSCRSAMLHYRSQLLEIIHKLAFSAFFLFGNMEEKQNVHVELFSSYLEPDGQHVTDIFIEIQTKQIEVYSAKFTVSANFSGLRYVMFHWPIISAAIGITSNLFFIAIVSLISWYQILNSEEYLEYIKKQGNKEQQKQTQRKIVLSRESSTEEEEDVSLIGSEELEDVKQRRLSSTNC